jgi:hypothetical protein
MLMKSRVPRILLAVSLAAVLPLLNACSDGAASPTSPSTVDSARGVLVSQRFADVEPGGVRTIDFSLPEDGGLSVSVSWTDQNNSVYAVITSASCPDFRAQGCRVRAATAPRREQDTESRFNYADNAGTYRIWLRNDGPGTESLLVTVELAPASGPPAPPARPNDPSRYWDPSHR